MLNGISASDGIGIGRVIIIEEQSLEYTPKVVTDIDLESQRYKDAVEAFCKKKTAQAEQVRKSVGDKEAEILEGHIQIIKDPYLNGEIEKLIDEGQCAESALEYMCDMFISMFANADDELVKQRATDVRDIKKGMLSILLGVNDVDVTTVPKDTVIVTRELTPSVTSGIIKENVVGIITETGGVTAHSAILARGLEIPTVLGVEDVSSKLSTGDLVIVDGCFGTVILSPSEDEIQKYTEKMIAFKEKRNELEVFRGQKTFSADKIQYELVCNIGNVDDAVKAMEFDGEGVGVFRTEFLFMDRISLPSEDEQFEAYKKVALTLKDKPLIIRTLDIGGDKALPYLGLKKEENPFMGLRAIRYCLINQAVFKTQLRAILRASAFGNIKIMFPLITNLEEIKAGKSLIEEVKLELVSEGIDFDASIKVGIMIETASAAIMADVLAKESDFFSIGTNDLTGYTMSCDRGNSDVSYLYSPFQPSVLRLIKYTIECANKNKIPVGMCGEVAADKMMIPLLISFGITEFSVSAPSVLTVRKLISQWTKQDADKIAQHVMTLETEKEILDFLDEVI